MKKVSFHTLGCKLNYAETATLEKQFVDRGFVIVPFTEKADVCVVNTCSVTERADRECRQIVRRALRTSPDAFVAVMGCYAQLQPEEIASIDGVDVVLGAAEKFHLFDHSLGFQKFDAPKVFVGPIGDVSDFGPAYSGGVDGRTRAFLKVQDGCDFNCSFCTIPLARGKSRSQSVDVCLLQAQHLVDQGYKEIILTGVNVGDYGKQAGSSLLTLLRRLEMLDGVERIRVSSIEPNLLNAELLRFWTSSKKMCNHFHIPLQSGSDEILRKMRRRYTTDDYRKLVDTIRSYSPDTGIGADVIVGFPGESEGLFAESVRFLEQLNVSYLHVFTYSERPDTPSLSLPGRVEPRERFRRSEILRMLGKKKKESFYRLQVGSDHSVLVEGAIENNMLSGFTSNYTRVFVPRRSELVNTIVDVRVEGVTEEGCLGAIVRERPMRLHSAAASALMQSAGM